MFVSKKRNDSQIEKDYITEEFRVSKKDVNQIVETNSDRWENYEI